MEPFISFCRERSDAFGNVGRAVRRCADPWRRSIGRSAGLALHGNDEERGSEALFDLQITVEFEPEVVGQSEVDERQCEGCRDVAS